MIESMSTRYEYIHGGYMSALKEWRRFMARSGNQFALPIDLRRGLIMEFEHLCDIFGQNESPVFLAIRVCDQHPESDVARVLNAYVEKSLR